MNKFNITSSLPDNYRKAWGGIFCLGKAEVIFQKDRAAIEDFRRLIEEE